MADNEFEWDEAKAAENATKHGVSFEIARKVFEDGLAVDWIDDPTQWHSADSLGARRGNPMSGANTTKARRKASTKHDWRRFDAMTAKERHAAALSDPDAQPCTAEQLARAKYTPRAKIIRRALGLTQEEFAARFRIPLGTLRDWEQGAAEPDQAARAYLKVIAVNPEAVRKALQFRPKRVRPSSEA